MLNTTLAEPIVDKTLDEKTFELLESIDWKLWEMMNMMKSMLPPTEDTTNDE